MNTAWKHHKWKSPGRKKWREVITSKKTRRKGNKEGREINKKEKYIYDPKKRGQVIYLIIKIWEVTKDPKTQDEFDILKDYLIKFMGILSKDNGDILEYYI